MHKFEKLKGKFTQRWLSNSSEYYLPIFVRLYNAQFNYLDRKGYTIPLEAIQQLKAVDKIGRELDLDDSIIAELRSKLQIEDFDKDEFRAMLYLQAGFGDWSEIAASIDTVNRGFIKLLEAAEPLAAMPLIRLQLENLTYIAAELKYPFRILHKVFIEGKQLSEIKIKNKAIVPSAIRKEFDEEHSYNLDELYKAYSSYVHPSSKQTNFEYNVYYSNKEGKEVIPQKEIKRLCKDMIYINRIIAILLLAQTFKYNSGLIHYETAGFSK